MQHKNAPNIVVIMADQLAPHFCGAYGHPLVKTPNMDALSEEGMLFDAAYCNVPLCAPSRMSFMSGQLITRIAGYDNGSEFPAAIPSFAHYLRRMGYRTCLSGKMHFVGPDQLHGFEERLTTDVYPSDYAWTPDWEMPDERIDKWYHNMESVREAGVANTTFQIEYDEETCFFARRRIFEYAMKNINPFILVASFIHPHDPYVARPEWWNLYRDEDIDMPTIAPAADPHTKRVMAGIEADKVQVNDRQIRNARRAYYANVSYFDDNVGKLINALKEADLYDNTVVIVTADHGDMLGERGLWYKMNFFEHSARVPLLIAGAGIKRGRNEQPVSLVDLLPTFLDIAAAQGNPKPTLGQPIDGRSLLPLLRGESEGDNEHERCVFGEYCAECASHPLFMIRRGDLKYIHCDIDEPQLFDVVNDPGETQNLIHESSHQQAAKHFANEVKTRWNSEKIRADVIATQKQRRAVQKAMESGKFCSWDYHPQRDAAQEFVRNHMDWTVAAETQRYPPLPKGENKP